MATEPDCVDALHRLAARLAAHDGASDFTRTLSVTLTDLGVVYGGKLHGGTLTDIRIVPSADAQIRLTMTSDDLLRLVDGDLNLASAWATGRVKVHAGMRDLLKLRTML